MKRWTNEEIQILKDNYKIKSHEDLCRVLPDRTWCAIKIKSEKLKLYFYGTPIERFWKYVNKKSDDKCWNWTASCFTNGYGQIRIKDKIISTHRFSWVLHNGTIPNDKPLVLHHCDNPKCVNPSHLFLGTDKDNSDDKVKKNRQYHPKGENNCRARLTSYQVKQIRDLKGKFLQREIAEIFGVSRSIIGHIHRDKIWKHIRK